MSWTQSMANVVYNYIKYGTAGGSSTTRCYLGLLTDEPTENGVLRGEVSMDTGYERLEIGELLSSPAYDSTNSQFVITNASEINFPHVEQAVTGITHWGIFTTKTGGNCIIFGAFNQSTNLAINDVFTIEKNNLNIILK